MPVSGTLLLRGKKDVAVPTADGPPMNPGTGWKPHWPHFIAGFSSELYTGQAIPGDGAPGSQIFAYRMSHFGRL